MSGDVADNRHEAQPAAGSIGTSLTVFYLQARNWAIGSDPGLLRLRMAYRTTAALGSALLILFLLTKATGQPLTVALLGVLIAMVVAIAALTLGQAISNQFNKVSSCINTPSSGNCSPA